jgi:hypothetical protein
LRETAIDKVATIEDNTTDYNKGITVFLRKIKKRA